MMRRAIFSLLAATTLAVTLGAKPAAEREVGKEASIAFPERGGIRNFRADNDRGIWIEDRNRNWYYASFLGVCSGIKFANSIAFDTRGSLRFDRHSTILTEDERCAIERFLTADKPLPEREQRRLIEQERKRLAAEGIS